DSVRHGGGGGGGGFDGGGGGRARRRRRRRNGNPNHSRRPPPILIGRRHAAPLSLSSLTNHHMRKTTLLLAIFPGALAAQSAPAIRLVNAADASTKPVFGLITTVRQLPNGSLLVNDPLKRQLTLLDPTLATSVVVADSSSG